MFKECSLYGMQFTIFRQTFNSCNLIALMHDGKCEAGVHASSVHVDSASPTLTVIASFFGAGKLKIFAQSVQQSDAGLELKTMFLAIDFQRHRYRARRADIRFGSRVGLGIGWSKQGSGRSCYPGGT